MRLANDIAAAAMEHVRGVLRPGHDRARRPRAIGRASCTARAPAGRARSSSRCAFSLDLVGPGDPHVHRHRRPRRSQEGEPTLFEIWVCADGYWCDHTKNLVPGELKPRYRELEQRPAARSTTRRVDSAAPGREPRRARPPRPRGHRGARLPRPAVAPDLPRRRRPRARAALRAPGRSTARSREGMVLAIEPGCYWPEGGGLRVEDNFLVTAAGPREALPLPGRDRECLNSRHAARARPSRTRPPRRCSGTAICSRSCPGPGASDYERYLRTDELLALQKTPEEMTAPRRGLFQTVHQSSELWLKLAVFETEEAIARIGADDLVLAVRLLGRANHCVILVTDALHVLERLSPWEYHELRKALGHGSGFDSPGWKRMRAPRAAALGRVHGAARRAAGLELSDVYVREPRAPVGLRPRRGPDRARRAHRDLALGARQDGAAGDRRRRRRHPGDAGRGARGHDDEGALPRALARAQPASRRSPTS